MLADKDPSFRPENFCRVIRALCLARLSLFTEVSRGIDYQLWLVESHREL